MQSLLLALGLALPSGSMLPPAAGPQSRDGVLLRYDTNRDGRLDAAERAQARAHLERRPTAFGRSVARVDDTPAARRTRLMERFDLDRNGALSAPEATHARESFASARARATRPEADPLRAGTPSTAPSNPFGFPDWPAETSAPIAGATPERSATPLASAPAPSPQSGRAPSIRTGARASAPAPEAPSARSRPSPSPAIAPVKRDPFYNQPVPSGKAGGKSGGRGKAGAGGAKPGGGGRRAGRGPIF